MKDSNNEFSDEDRQRISKDAASLLNQIRNMPGDNFTCGLNKGLEKQKEHCEKEISMQQAILSTLNDALIELIESQENSTKYSLTTGSYIITEDSPIFRQIYIQPKTPTFFNSKLGNKNGIELFALTITIQLSFKGLELKMEIISHFNPDKFRNTKIEYTDTVTTGTHRHLEKEHDYKGIDSVNTIKNVFQDTLTSIIKFYIP